MQVTHSVTIGWPWFGIGKIRYHVTETGYYTMWMLFLTTKFAVGFHVGGTSRMSEEDEQELADWELSRQSREESADEEMFAEHLAEQREPAEEIREQLNREFPDDIDYDTDLDRAVSGRMVLQLMTSTARAASEEREREQS